MNIFMYIFKIYKELFLIYSYLNGKGFFLSDYYDFINLL